MFYPLTATRWRTDWSKAELATWILGQQAIVPSQIWTNHAWQQFLVFAIWFESNLVSIIFGSQKILWKAKWGSFDIDPNSCRHCGRYLENRFLVCLQKEKRQLNQQVDDHLDWVPGECEVEIIRVWKRKFHFCGKPGWKIGFPKLLVTKNNENLHCYIKPSTNLWLSDDFYCRIWFDIPAWTRTSTPGAPKCACMICIGARWKSSSVFFVLGLWPSSISQF